MVRDRRGVSNVLGLTLLFAIVIAGMVAVVALGGTALTDTRESLDTSRAEKAMTQFDSRSAMVALGGTSHQGVDFGAGTNGQYGVDAERGWMNVTIYNETAKEHTRLVNVTLGALVYENGGETIAYQGGGVWQRTDGGVRMLSPPEFHFRDQTLTLPIITVGGSASVGPTATVSRAGPTTVFYPNETSDANFTNPMASGHVNVTVHSEYYEAWGEYFAQRTDGNVTYDHEAETARVQLVVPFEEDFDDAVATTQPGGITVNGGSDPPDESETGVYYPLADQRIDDRIEDCEAGGCDTTTAFDSITSGGTYYTDGDFSGDVVVSNPGDDVTIVVNGKFEPTDVDITSDHNVSVLVKNSATNGVTVGPGETINEGGVPGNFSVVVHSNVQRVKFNGDYKFVGFLYAPGSECKLDGGGSNSPNIVGGTVCETATLDGNPNDYQYDASIEKVTLHLDGDITPITFLHVTTNPINVTGG